MGGGFSFGELKLEQIVEGHDQAKLRLQVYLRLEDEQPSAAKTRAWISQSRPSPISFETTDDSRGNFDVGRIDVSDQGTIQSTIRDDIPRGHASGVFGTTQRITFQVEPKARLALVQKCFSRNGIEAMSEAAASRPAGVAGQLLTIMV